MFRDNNLHYQYLKNHLPLGACLTPFITSIVDIFVKIHIGLVGPTRALQGVPPPPPHLRIFIFSALSPQYFWQLCYPLNLAILSIV
jgi:hypothetical protein